MMTEHHPSIRRHKILAVVLHNRWCRTFVIQNEHLRRQPFAIKTIADRGRAKARRDDPECADRFTARKR